MLREACCGARRCRRLLLLALAVIHVGGGAAAAAVGVEVAVVVVGDVARVRDAGRGGPHEAVAAGPAGALAGGGGGEGAEAAVQLQGTELVVDRVETARTWRGRDLK